MSKYKKDFCSFDREIWLNAASEGPLPKTAAKALEAAIEWKSKPYQLDTTKFISVPKGLKESIAKLIGVSARDVILGNSASYGLHILANGIPWKADDEIVVMQNDFPTDILPWLGLEKRGVKIRQIKAQDKVLSPKELAANLTPRTRLFCISHVHTFTGFILDIEQFAKICQNKGIIFVLNISQSAGTMPIDMAKINADAVVCAGYKWLCGPYGTGFAWIKPTLRDQLDLNRSYWISLLSEEELQSEGPLKHKDLKTARKFDVFGTANFFNFVPFKEAIDYWLEVGLDRVRTYHDRLIEYLTQGLDPKQYDFISPKEEKFRSSLVVVSHKDKKRNFEIFQNLAKQGIHAGFWKSNIRIAAHVYNTEEEIDQLTAVLKTG